ncbi:MAG: HAD family hydrolase [Christensenellales bacterium]
MQRLVVFDLDGTLAEIGRAVKVENVDKLKEIEGYASVAICSGKPIYYLCGLTRQLGLKKPIHIGENGAVICFGYDLPPSRYERVKVDKNTKSLLAKLREEIEEKLGDGVWFQPNEVALTPFPRGEKEWKILDEIVQKYRDVLQGVNVYRQCDCYDFCPCDIDKAVGVEKVTRLLGVSKEGLFVVGDGDNDVSMLRLTDNSYGIDMQDKSVAKINCNSVDEALDAILASLKNEK